jgi:hypothetical protein
VVAAPVTGDRRILGLFRQWAEAWRYSASIAARDATDEEMAAAVAKATPFQEAIIETPAEGILGLAVKVYFLHDHDHSMIPDGERSDDACALYPPSENERGSISAEMSLSAIRDIARLVPELAPLCAPALAGEP